MLGASFEHKSKSVIVTAFVSILFMMVLVVGISYYRMSANYQDLSSRFESQYQLINTLVKLRHIAHERIVTTLLIIEETDVFDRYDKLEYFSDLATEFLKTLEEIEASNISEREKQAVRDALKKFNERASLLTSAIDLIEDERIDEARKLIHEDTMPLQAGLMGAYDDLFGTIRSDMRYLFQSSNNKNRLTLGLTLLLVAVSLAVAGFVARFVVRYINKTEKALQMEKENALVTLHSIEDGVIRTDANNNIIYLNPSAESILEKNTESLAGKAVCDVVSICDGATGKPVGKPFNSESCVAEIGSGKQDMYLVRFNGERIWVENSITAIKDADGTVSGNVLVIHDITENHNTKEQMLSLNRDLAELNTTLEDRVRIRTEELENTIKTLSDTQDKLVHSEKMASLGNLVAGISHEINTPLGIAVTSASSLHEETSTMQKRFNDNTLKRSDMDAFLQHSEQASNILLQNLGRASNMIRSFKQVAVDQTTEDWRTVELKNYIDEILMSLRPKLKCKKIDVINDCDSGLTIYTNPGAIYQIISNFILNSLVHAYDEPMHTGVIRIYAKQENGLVTLEYMDDGKGVADEIRKRMFDPFFTTKRGQGGSGLGLNIVYNLINTTLHGKVDVASAPDKGTKFVTIFPVQYERGAS
jgi:signal transduction histidine kinase